MIVKSKERFKKWKLKLRFNILFLNKSFSEKVVFYCIEKIILNYYLPFNNAFVIFSLRRSAQNNNSLSDANSLNMVDKGKFLTLQLTHF